MPTIERPKREADVPARALVAFLAPTFAVTWSAVGFYVVAPTTAAALLGEIDGVNRLHGGTPLGHGGRQLAEGFQVWDPRPIGAGALRRSTPPRQT